MRMKRVLCLALMLTLCAALFAPCVAPVAQAASTVKLYRVNGTGVRMRSEAYGYNDLNIMGTVKKGTTCILLDTKGNWCRVATENCKIGWIYNKYLTYYGVADKDTVGICTTNRVRVYASYSTSAKKIGTLNKGNVILVKRYNSVWAEITTLTGGKSGYVKVGYLHKAYK